MATCIIYEKASYGTRERIGDIGWVVAGLGKDGLNNVLHSFDTQYETIARLDSVFWSYLSLHIKYLIQNNLREIQLISVVNSKRICQSTHQKKRA